MELGVFAQDAWKINRFTLNLGIRFDRLSMGYPAAPTPRRLVRSGTHGHTAIGRSDLGRHQSAPWRRLRRVRQRANGGQICRRPLQSAEPQRFHAPVPSVQLVDQLGVSHLDRHEQQLHPGLRRPELRGAGPQRQRRRHVRADQQRELRQVHPVVHGVRRLDEVSPTATSCGTSTSTCSTKSCTGCRWTPATTTTGTATSPSPRTLLIGPVELRRVLHHGAERSASAERRSAAVRLLRHPAGALRAGHAARHEREGVRRSEREHQAAPAVLGWGLGEHERATPAQYRAWRRSGRGQAGRRPLFHRGHSEPAARHQRDGWRDDELERPQLERTRHVSRGDGLEEQLGLPVPWQRAIQGRIHRQLHLPKHAGCGRERKPDGDRG